MKTISFFLLSLLLVASLPCIAAINYNITFTGSGASSTVGDVIVQNLTQGTIVTVPAGNVLNLSDGLTAVEQLNANDETIRIIPSTMGGKSTLSFFAKQAGSAQINVYRIDGKKVVSINQNLQGGSNSYQLSLPGGSYAIQVVGNEYSYNTKMINQSASLSKPEINYIGTKMTLSNTTKKSKSSALSTTTMIYTTGDRLLYKGTSGNYSTIVTDVPTADKTINFDFIACTDGDGNNYKVVKIGDQIWMAENLKTTRYNDGSSIPHDKPLYSLNTPGYCWYKNDSTTYHNTYGVLYNWYALTIDELAPKGWHIPSDVEWTNLVTYLKANSYNYDGTTSVNKYAKSLAATTNWNSYINTGVPGNELFNNNSTGFSALPGGGVNPYGGFDYIGDNGYWWSITETTRTVYESSYTCAWVRGIYFNNVSGFRLNYGKQSGFSVRCIKN